jgi:hypothetical protein
LLSVSYYTTEIKTKNVDDSFDFGYNVEKLEQTFLSSYMSLLICANTTIENSVNKTFFKKKTKILIFFHFKFVDQEFGAIFKTMFENNSFSEAIGLLQKTEQIPLISQMEYLLSFLFVIFNLNSSS